MHTQDTQDKLRVAVIVGSTREGRAGRNVADWFADQAGHRAELDIDLIDLADFDFPAHYVHQPTPDTAEFARRIDEADAFIVVTPEYNHSYPASLKQAIDYAYSEWNAKPVGFVSYGGTARGLLAVEHLRAVFAELHTATIRDTVSFNLFDGSIDVRDNRWHRAPDAAEVASKKLLDQLIWWGYTLRQGRRTSPYNS